MDVRSSFIFTLTFPLALTLSACDQPRREEVVFPKATEECQSSALKNQYLVRWADGHISQERGASREIFMESFLRPQLQKIDRVEHDQYIQLEPTNESDGEDNDSPVPDNWAIDKIGVAQAWAQGIRGQGIVVAVIDSGVDIHHPQLKDQIFHNPGEEGFDDEGFGKSTNGIDDDGNGLIDDVNGYDFNQQSGSMHDNSFHGTHIAGIIAAEHNDTSRKSGYVQELHPQPKSCHSLSSMHRVEAPSAKR